MLVQSRSKACGTCQIRKVKCDRSDPACSQCKRGKWACPGYTKSWKRRDRTAGIHEYEHQWLLATQAKSKLTAPHHAKIVINSTILPSHIQDSTIQLSREVIAHLEDKRPPGLHIRNLGQFFDFIPSRLGHNQALDDAVRCILTAYSTCLQPEADSLNKGREEYYTALRSLQVAFDDDKLSLSDETLCAAVLLSWYEVLADNLDESWLTHIGGTSHIIQLRGPARHRSGFGLALLQAQGGLISGRAMMTCTPNFLDSPEWAVLLNDQNMVVGLPQTQYLTLSNKVLAQLSNLLIDAKNLAQLSEGGIDELIQGLWTVRKTIKKALDDLLELAPQAEHEYASIIYSKNSAYLILVDVTILQTLSAAPLTSDHTSNIISNLNDFSMPPQVFTDTTLFTNAIDKEIYQAFDTFVEHLEIASKVSPFNVKKMAFMCRIMCAERRKRDGELHGVWEVYERVIGEVNRVDWLARVVASQGEGL